MENGHTIPSLGTLAKIAGGPDVPLAHFFVESSRSDASPLPQLREDDARFLAEVRRYSSVLNGSDRELVLTMLKEMAENAAK